METYRTPSRQIPGKTLAACLDQAVEDVKSPRFCKSLYRHPVAGRRSKSYS
jgi:hypothetical protein